ncbi:unnamed protein product [Discula destructiva]
MADNSEPEKLCLYAEEEPSGDWLYADGVLSEKTEVEEPQHWSSSKAPRGLEALGMLVLSTAALALTLAIIHDAVFLTPWGFTRESSDSPVSRENCERIHAAWVSTSSMSTSH